MRSKPWDVPDELWERIEPLLPRKPRRYRYPGRKPFDDRLALQGILFVLTKWRLALNSAAAFNGPCTLGVGPTNSSTLPA
jgi:transposase